MRGSERVETRAFHRPIHPPLENRFAEKMISSHSLGCLRRVVLCDHPDRIRIGATRVVSMIPIEL